MSDSENGPANIVYVFRGGTNRRELCFSVDSETANLPAPASGGRWHYWKAIENFVSPENRLRMCIAYGADFYEIFQELTEKGYALREQTRLLRPG